MGLFVLYDAASTFIPWHFPSFSSSPTVRPVRGEYRSSGTEHHSNHKPPVYLKLR